MAYDLSKINAQPGLREWIISGKWKHFFDRNSLSRSGSYVSERFIRQVNISEAVSGGGVIAGALVLGEAPKPYQTDIYFDLVRGQWSVDPDCSCPVVFGCKHAAALLAFIAGDLARVGQGTAYFNAELRSWLREIETAAGVVPVAERAAPAKPENRFLAYCIEEPGRGEGRALNFALRVGTRQKDGGIKISESRAAADLSKPPKYMVHEDFLATALYQQRLRNRYMPEEIVLEGDDWEVLLEAAHATGRLFWGRNTDDSGRTKTYQPVTLGPPRTVTAVWKVTPSGSAKPELQCETPGTLVISTRPLRYLDPVNGVLGIAVSDLPAAVLSAWQEGPAVSASDLALISERFATISSTSLPIPLKIETETRAPSPPQPHLRVYSRTLGKSWDLRVMIVGLLSFRYADSRLLTPLARGHPQSHAEVRNGKRICWTRDFEAEQALAMQLRKTGFMSLTGILPSASLDTAALHSVVPAESSPSPQLGWLALLESPQMQALRDSGWTIEVDAKSGLTAHDASEFFPAIESDPDHGIDWFRFDITFELQGKKVSLIPIIAQAIRMDLPSADDPDLPEFLSLSCEDPADGFIRFPTKRLIEMVDQVRHLFHGNAGDGPIRIDRLAAAGVADTLALDSSETLRALAKLGHNLKTITDLPPAELPASVRAELRHYQLDGYRWLQFLAAHGLHGILADDMGLGKT
ncbi:hypothetical protein HQ447_03025, partial [bacterium]|nr:hypothetical protein [bacterium]